MHVARGIRALVRALVLLPLRASAKSFGGPSVRSSVRPFMDSHVDRAVHLEAFSIAKLTEHVKWVQTVREASELDSESGVVRWKIGAHTSHPY